MELLLFKRRGKLGNLFKKKIEIKLGKKKQEQLIEILNDIQSIELKL